MIVKCPTCKKPVSWEDVPTKPFCSERCRLLDLGKWLNEDYKVPCVEPEDDYLSEDGETTGGIADKQQ